eukprot:TRINITY_DN16524_c0_g1_i1.p1 TRINITY_DN16524_c0_g1~~TRINITY_DN16524_c0_g1_i1.p1  ORF type:complete len:939 (+),score=142.08 TRINITY_DN16524_c0_g1_i1:34-2817(+)
MASCPIFAQSLIADLQGDCLCQSDRPICFENGRQQCRRADGRLDLHYFAATCTTCACQSSGLNGSARVFPSCASADGAQARSDTLPDQNGLCSCPEARPFCISVSGPFQELGCLGTGSWSATSHGTGAVPCHLLSEPGLFPADCSASRCSCRAECPSFAKRRFADMLGDCACPDAKPKCYQGGQPGCTTNSVGSTPNYFAASCGTPGSSAASCECHAVSTGQCDARFCTQVTSCSFSMCRDCEICRGISRCPVADTSTAFPDATGNCQCGAEQQCFEKDSRIPGCPLAPTGTSLVRFSVSCLDCACNTTSSVLSISCPSFARSLDPGFEGDCVCPSGLECYQDGKRWCTRNGGQRDLFWFDPFCTTCECRPASSDTIEAQKRPCPSFARSPLSNPSKNCACPDHRPVCVETGGDSSSAAGRPGPLCRTAQGVLSPTEFRFDCDQCSCVDAAGEGSNLRGFREEELMSSSGNTYVRLALAVDLRLVNTRNTVGDWTIVETGVLFGDSGRQAFAEAAARSVSENFGYSLVGFCQELQSNSAQIFPGGDFEDVRVQRVQANLGLRQSSRRLQLLQPKALTDLTQSEKELLVNIAAVYRPSVFKEELDFQLQKLLNDTAAWVGTSTSMQAPRVSVSRADLLEAGGAGIGSLPALALSGPLEARPPVTQSLQASSAEEEAAGSQSSADTESSTETSEGGFDFVTLLPIAIGIGGALGGLLAAYLLYRFVRRCFQKRRERWIAEHKGGNIASQGSGDASGSPHGGGPEDPEAPPSRSSLREGRGSMRRASISVIDRGSGNAMENGKMNTLAVRQKEGMKTTSAAAKAALKAEEDGVKDQRGSPKGRRGRGFGSTSPGSPGGASARKGFFGRFRSPRSGRTSTSDEGGSTARSSPRSPDASARSPRSPGRSPSGRSSRIVAGSPGSSPRSARSP